MTIGFIAMVIALKLIACLVSLASGFRGGLFFCSLFVGSLLGKFFAAVVAMMGYGITLDPTVSMLTGMATLGVAIVGGPLTMSFLVLEMTRSVDVTAVVLAGCIVTSIFVRFMFGHSFSTWRLHLRGETIRSANDVGWLRNLTVERMMRSDVGKVPTTTTIAACRREFVLGSRQAIVVVNNTDEYCRPGDVAGTVLRRARHHRRRNPGGGAGEIHGCHAVAGDERQDRDEDLRRCRGRSACRAGIPRKAAR